MNRDIEDAARRVRRAAEYRATQDLDPDWWVKELIIRERLTGLAPEPFLLRNDDAALDGRLRRESSEAEVRQILLDFNRRVINARRQLLGGPPVTTPTRDVEVEVARWKAGRRPAGPTPMAGPAETRQQRRRWWQRPGR